MRRLLTALMILVGAMGIFTLGAAPAKANTVTGAVVTVNCNSYTISLNAIDLDFGRAYTINWTFTLTPTTGPAITVTGSTGNIFGDANGNYSSGPITTPLGPISGNFTMVGTAELPGESRIDISFTNSGGTVSCSTPPVCPGPSSNISNFNGTPISGGDWIWFNANFKAIGVPKTGATLSFTGQTIQFMAGTTAYNLTVPNAKVTFSPSASCSSTTFDSITNTFITTVPVGGDDEVFLSGLAFPVPTPFGTANGLVKGNVAWTGTFGSSVSGVSAQWKWGAAVYTSFTTDYNALGIKAGHQTSCLYLNGDHAGTPEGVNSSNKTWQSFVTGGARGGGGSNFTGSWSGTINFNVTCAVTP